MNELQQRGVLWIAIFLFLYLFSLSAASVPQKQWLLKYVCRQRAGFETASWKICSHNSDVHAETARWDMLTSLAAHLPALLTCSIIGSFSDRFGRKPILLINAMIGVLEPLLLIFISKFNLSLWSLFGVRLLLGLSGHYGVILAVASAYTADCTNDQTRTKGVMVMQSVSILSTAIGPALGGALSRFLKTGALGVIQLTLYCRLSAIAFLLFIVKESVPEKLASQEKSIPLWNWTSMAKQALKNSFSVFFKKNVGTTWAMLIGIVFTRGIILGCGSSFFYWTAFVHNWDAFDHGLLLLSQSLSKLLFMAVLYPCLQQVITTSTRLDVFLMRMSSFGYALARFLYTLVIESFWMYPIGILEGLGSISSSIARGILSKLGSAQSQGSLFSGIQTIEQLGYLLATSIMPAVWSVTVGSPLTNLTLHIEAIIIFLGFFIILPVSSTSLARMQDEEVTASDLESKAAAKAKEIENPQRSTTKTTKVLKSQSAIDVMETTPS